MMKRVMAVALIVLGTMTGCGGGKSQYVGKWVYEDEYVQEVLEIKRDGTYKYEVKGKESRAFGRVLFPATVDVGTGEWSADKDGISFLRIGSGPDPGYLQRPRKGDCLVTVTGRTYVKQK